MRSAAQSPPPITLPARAVAMRRCGVWCGGCRRSWSASWRSPSRPQPCCAVGVVAAQRVVLAIALEPLVVLVHLVGGDHHHRAGLLQARAGPPAVKVPITLVAQVADGIGVAARTRGWAARWKHHLRVRLLRPAPSAHGQHRGCRRCDGSRRSASCSWSNRLRLVSGGEREAGDLGPQLLQPEASQLPLKPVWPVTSTRWPAQKDGLGASPDLPGRPAARPTALRGSCGRAGCPWAARSRGAR